jgi:hypothetical protein
MGEKPRRRWWQFGTRTLLIAVVLLSVPFGLWIERAQRWIKQRAAFAETIKWGVQNNISRDGSSAPWMIAVLGEHGAWAISCWEEDDEYARELFPEADVYLHWSHERRKP